MRLIESTRVNLKLMCRNWSGTICIIDSTLMYPCLPCFRSRSCVPERLSSIHAGKCTRAHKYTNMRIHTGKRTHGQTDTRTNKRTHNHTQSLTHTHTLRSVHRYSKHRYILLGKCLQLTLEEEQRLN